MCQCKVVGDPLAVLFDKQPAVLNDHASYLMSFINPFDPACFFAMFVQTDEELSGLIVPDGVQLTFNLEGNPFNIFITHEGFFIKTQFVDLPFSDEHVSVSAVGEDGLAVITMVNPVCKYQIYAKLDGVHSAISLMVDADMSPILKGMCGNCNGVRDDYILLNGTDFTDLVDAPLKIAESYKNALVTMPTRQ